MNLGLGEKVMDDKNNPANVEQATEAVDKNLMFLTVAALGVVFGDIGTSPLYAIRECFHGEYAIPVSDANILGILSLIFWSLITVVTVKYLIFIMRADNQGEGGVLALASLLKQTSTRSNKARWVLIGAGLFGAALLYGDGMITPAISVLSAIEGIKVVAPHMEHYVIPATVLILAMLFLVQHHGTARVGSLFGPIIFIWFTVLAALGIPHIIDNPRILMAFIPTYGIEFLLHNHVHGFLVLGAVFLVVTGAEAIYADMGHFGRKPIRLAWLGLVLPALMINYFGQGAVLLLRPEDAYHPFYSIVPAWGKIPMVVLATVATIIASQAVITGAFSLTRQAIQLGYLPRLKIDHTSSRHFGQIYVSQVNWILMIATIFLVLGLRSSSKLAAAYGVAVTSTMLITTLIFYYVARERWNWSRLQAGIPALIFLVVDLAFFSANISKIFHGAWFPLVIGGAVFTLMIVWSHGRTRLSEVFTSRAISIKDFMAGIEENPPKRIDGQAIFLSGKLDITPLALLHNLKHNKILHSDIVIMHFATERVPRVPNLQKIEINKLGKGFSLVTARFGFMESPNIKNILSLMNAQGLDFKMEKTSFFLGRERLLVDKKDRGQAWWKRLYIFMSKNSYDVASYYDIPTDKIIELGVQLKM